MFEVKLCFLIFCLTNCWTFIQSDGNIEEENLIATTLLNALNYKVDTDARRYQPTNSVAKDYGTFDFVVIGGGTAGPVIANRLSENENWNVLLIEAGKFANSVTDSPAMAFLSMLSDYNWGFYSVPQKTACLGMVDKRCPYPRGRGVGGSSLINAIAQARGHPGDYDKWAAMGNSGWSYKDLLPYFIKLEDFNKNYENVPVNWDYHGKNGPCPVTFSLINSTADKAFHEAHKELGLPYTDYNSPQQIGSSPIQFYLKNGKRQDAGTAYIKPILSRKNLVVLTESYATKIDIDSTNTAKGVYFTRNTTLYYVKASKEVILSAGSFQSPQLLMLSGVGPQDHLTKYGIRVLKDLSVGNNLIDHMSIYLFLSGNFPDRELPIFKKDILNFLNGEGTLTSTTTISSLSFLKTNYSAERPDVELVAIPNRINKFLSSFPFVFRYTLSTLLGFISSFFQNEIFTLEYIYLHPVSTGTVRLNSNSPYDYPLIDPNILSNSEDLDRMYAGLQEIFKLINTNAFQKYNITLAPINLTSCGSYHYPVSSKEFWRCYMKQTSYPFYHPVGTCSMGPDPKQGAVVDNNLNVYGIKNLRVADASVVPVTVSGHTAAIAMVVGEKVADLIKAKYQ